MDGNKLTFHNWITTLLHKKKRILFYLHGLTTHTEGNSKVLMKEFEGSPSLDEKTITMAVTEVFRDVKANP
jgi:hypothetical protein